VTVLTGLQRGLYLACDAVRTSDELERLLSEEMGSRLSPDDIEATAEPLIAAGILLRAGDLFLSLAIPLSPSESVLERFEGLVEKLGTTSGEVIVVTRTDAFLVSAREACPLSAA
jgi:hypothetical protein